MAQDSIQQMSLWGEIYPLFKFPKNYRVRMFEAFSGIGCQAMALKRITDNYELVGFSEIDKYAIQSYRAIHGEVKNYGDITKMESIPSCDIFTYSFPCTDLSKAGKQAGLGKETRSGLVWEVLRLLQNTEDKPKVLIMENVVDLVQVNFVKQFNEIQYELEKLGYKNYNEVLNAKDYGIPQNRERVFMVSILGDNVNNGYSYEFPRKQKLELRLKDLLETSVSEKYYLTQRAIDGFVKSTQEAKAAGNGFKFEPKDGETIANAVLVKPGQRKDDNFIKESIIDESYYLTDKMLKYINSYNNKYKVNPSNLVINRSVGCTVNTRTGQSRADTSDYVDEQVGEDFKIDGIELQRVAQLDGFEKNGRVYSPNGIAPTVQLRIRKLTERECWRLMGITDSDFEKAKSSGVSKSQLYKQAGNGIVVNVFEAILRGLFE